MLKQIKEYLTTVNFTRNFMENSSCYKNSFYRNMQATGPYRYTATFDEYFKNSTQEDQ
jgi:hypothetical protein